MSDQPYTVAVTFSIYGACGDADPILGNEIEVHSTQVTLPASIVEDDSSPISLDDPRVAEAAAEALELGRETFQIMRELREAWE